MSGIYPVYRDGDIIAACAVFAEKITTQVIGNGKGMLAPVCHFAQSAVHSEIIMCARDKAEAEPPLQNAADKCGNARMGMNYIVFVPLYFARKYGRRAHHREGIFFIERRIYMVRTALFERHDKLTAGRGNAHENAA